MLPLHARSTLAELAQLASWRRCYDMRARADQPRFRDIYEVNDARAKREASISMGCPAHLIRVEPLPALKSLQVA